MKHLDVLSIGETLIDLISDAKQVSLDEAPRYMMYAGGEATNVALNVARLGGASASHLYGELKNQPYKYHNGGLWPILTGLYAVGLAWNGQQERGKHLLAALNAANAREGAKGQWGFAEYHHGRTHEPQGTNYLAWSAAAGVLAHEAVWRGRNPLSI